MSIEYLTILIEQKRRKMLNLAKIEGLQSEKTIIVSKELDELVLEYQNMFKY